MGQISPNRAYTIVTLTNEGGAQMRLTLVKNKGHIGQETLELLEGGSQSFLQGNFEVEVAPISDIARDLNIPEEELRSTTNCKGDHWARVRFTPGTILPEKFFRYEGFAPHQADPRPYTTWKCLSSTIEHFATLDEDLEIIVVDNPNPF